MPMMRRGPLDRYPVEWVLREAAAHRVDGALELQSDETVTVYLQGGLIYGATPGPAADAVEGDLPADEDEARAQTVALLTRVVHARTGWYHHDPLGHLPGAGTWGWESAALVAATRPPAPAPPKPTAPAPGGPAASVHPQAAAGSTAAGPTSAHPSASVPERRFTLRPSRTGSVTISADAWALVAALAPEGRLDELAGRLGWDGPRAGAALDELLRAGLTGSPAADPAPRPDPGSEIAGGSGADDGDGADEPSGRRAAVLPFRARGRREART